uniref:Uncharacterized protein n=1 Tax=Corethron hystrix TaxID=216773 RepID=A0A7S1BR63_9STRA|mmetsp:Transcript_38031/g.88475  ORF Transcript_38031/g.88475 Transcript_38031/m.88475 type:complete len:1144 (+) Transcript_38031:300-3731(+)
MTAVKEKCPAPGSSASVAEGDASFASSHAASARPLVAPTELLSLGAYDNPGPYWTDIGAVRKRVVVKPFGYDDDDDVPTAQSDEEENGEESLGVARGRRRNRERIHSASATEASALRSRRKQGGSAPPVMSVVPRLRSATTAQAVVIPSLRTKLRPSPTVVEKAENEGNDSLNPPKQGNVVAYLSASCDDDEDMGGSEEEEKSDDKIKETDDDSFPSKQKIETSLSFHKLQKYDRKKDGVCSLSLVKKKSASAAKDTACDEGLVQNATDHKANGVAAKSSKLYFDASKVGATSSKIDNSLEDSITGPEDESISKIREQKGTNPVLSVATSTSCSPEECPMKIIESTVANTTEYGSHSKSFEVDMSSKSKAKQSEITPPENTPASTSISEKKLLPNIIKNTEDNSPSTEARPAQATKDNQEHVGPITPSPRHRTSHPSTKYNDTMDKIMHTLTNVHQYRPSGSAGSSGERGGRRKRGDRNSSSTADSSHHRTVEDDIAEIVKAAALAVGRGRRMETRRMERDGMIDGIGGRRRETRKGARGRADVLDRRHLAAKRQSRSIDSTEEEEEVAGSTGFERRQANYGSLPQKKKMEHVRSRKYSQSSADEEVKKATKKIERENDDVISPTALTDSPRKKRDAALTQKKPCETIEFPKRKSSRNRKEVSRFIESDYSDGAEAEMEDNGENSCSRKTMRQRQGIQRKTSRKDPADEHEDESETETDEKKDKNCRKGKGIVKKWDLIEDEAKWDTKKDSVKQKKSKKSLIMNGRGGDNSVHSYGKKDSNVNGKKRNRSSEIRCPKKEDEENPHSMDDSSQNDSSVPGNHSKTGKKKKKVKSGEVRKGSKTAEMELGKVEKREVPPSPCKKKKCQLASDSEAPIAIVSKKKKNKKQKCERISPDKKGSKKCDDGPLTSDDDTSTSDVGRMAYEVDENMNVVASSSEDGDENLWDQSPPKFVYRTPDGINLMDRLVEVENDASFLRPGRLVGWIPRHGHWNSSAWAGTGKSMEGCVGTIFSHNSVDEEDGQSQMEEGEDTAEVGNEQNRNEPDVQRFSGTKWKEPTRVPMHLQDTSRTWLGDRERKMGSKSISQNGKGSRRKMSEEMTFDELRKKGPPKVCNQISPFVKNYGSIYDIFILDWRQGCYKMSWRC